MPTYYTVAQYVPDPATSERINIGVIAFGDGQIRSRFVTDWKRVATFGRRKDVEFAKEFAKRVHGAAIASAVGVNQPSMLGGAGQITEQSLLKMIGEWSNLIQFTPAQVAIGSPDDLIPSLAQIFLRTPSREPRAFRDRQQAATFAVRTIREVVQRRVGAEEAKRALRVNYEVAGKLVKHLTVDLGIVNARVYEVAQAISFETHDMTELDRRRNEVIYGLDDIKRNDDRIQLDVVAFPPNPATAGFHQARPRYDDFLASCSEIRANVITEDVAVPWANSIANLVEEHIATSVARTAHM